MEVIFRIYHPNSTIKVEDYDKVLGFDLNSLEDQKSKAFAESIKSFIFKGEIDSDDFRTLLKNPLFKQFISFSEDSAEDQSRIISRFINDEPIKGRQYTFFYLTIK